MKQLNEEVKIRECLQQFVDGWSKDESLLDKCFIDEPFIEMSMFGYIYSVEMLKPYLNKPDKTNLNIEIINHSIVIKENEARQYATIIGIFKSEKRHLAFGGSFVNKVIKENENWKFHTMRFDLQCEDSVALTSLTKESLLYREPGFGDKNLIENWKTIDDRIGHNMQAIPNSGHRMISPEYDTPWYVIPNMEYKKDDNKQLRDLLYKYCYGFDFATFPVVCDIFDDNATLRIEEESFHNKRDIIGYLKLLRKAKPRSFNSVIFDEIDIDGDSAKIKALRISPDLVSLRKVNNNLKQWIHGYFEYKAVKHNNKWLITEFYYIQDER